MKNKKTSNKSPAQLKGKLMAALAMLLVASVLMGSTTYAWLVLSIAPEVTGISTNIGANGSLEIALLNTETRQNMNNISSGKVGESLANNNQTANNAWGNLVDLNAVNYGLNNIILMPARLDAVKNAGTEGYTVASGLLSVPTYGYDGRVVDVSKDAVSAVFKNKEFAFVPASQDYGVRAIGTSDSLTVQGSALAMAKSNVATYTNSANGAAAGSLANNGSAVFDIMVSHMLDANATFDDADMDVIMSMVSDLQSSVDYIDLALRQGLVGFAASVVDDVDQFETVRDKIIDQNKSISALLAEMDEFGEIPADFTSWVAVLETAKNDLNGAYTSCSQLTERGAPYAWEEILGALSKLMNLEGVYINDTKYSEFDKSQAGSLIGGDIVLTLAPGSGVFANVADFADDFSTIVSTMGTSVEITTETTQNPVYLAALSAAMTTLEAAGGSSGTQAVTLSATYGYALDLAFRCNASESDLLLQTSGIQRVYNDSVSATTQGGGSYMEFAVTDDIAQSILLMDAVRVAFIDDSGNLLAVAKLNTSNRQTTESVIKAPLYLYDFAISEEEDTKGMMVMGERKMTDNTITSLQKNMAKAITVVVWLDGDVVDNTMVSATEETSLSGMLNLQFASSADLIPAENSEYMAIVADRTGLESLVASYLETYENGQGTYTTVSWNKFAAAYVNAATVYADEAATDSQIKFVAANLQTAYNGLTVVSKAALNTKLSEIRDMMGETTDLARIVLLDENGNYIALGEYTQEQYDKRLTDIEIFRVDYSQNLRDEGNGIKTAIYSDESWSALASALYAAEAVNADEKATDEQINGALTTLETAHNALEHGAYFLPYDFNGTLYYYAVPKSANDDTYGKWYDAEFKRIVADKTILDLDAHAEEIDIAEIVYSDYLSWTFGGASGFVNILDDLYPELSEEVVAGLTWSAFDTSMFIEHIQQYHIAALNEIIKVNADNELGVDVSAAENLLDPLTVDITASEAEAVINDLAAKVNAALEEKLAQDAADAEAANPYMTADQRKLLVTALSAVQSIVDAYVPGVDEEGNPNPEDPQITAMKEDIANITAMLDGDVLKEDADANLAKLNSYLVANGKTAITFANTIVHTIPLGSEVTGIVYNVEYPDLSLLITGKTGTAVLGAIGVTKNGVIIDITHKVTVYTPADDVLFKTGTVEELVDIPATIAVGETLNVFALLDYSVTRDAKEIELGNVTIVDDKAEVAVPEHIESGIWHSGNINIATVTGSGTGSVTGIAPGVVTIDVSIETVEGNTYTESFTITVTP